MTHRKTLRNRNAVMILALAALVVPGIASQSFAADDAVVDSGAWTKKTASIAGKWSVVTRGVERFVVLDAAFKTKNAPDLKLFLSPAPLARLSGDNATEGAMFLGKLTSNKGGQEFAIPRGVDLKRFKTVIIHCEKYAKLWGGAALKKAE